MKPRKKGVKGPPVASRDKDIKGAYASQVPGALPGLIRPFS